jgi:hypothetical protein
MKNNTNTHPSDTTKPPQVKAKRIKLGIDVHADSYRVVRQLDHATPQPAQKFTPQDFLVWRKQLTLAEQVYSCYEAGPCVRACGPAAGVVVRAPLPNTGIGGFVRH